MVAAAKNGVRLFVYALCEPDGTTVRYIGLSGNLWKRLRNHFHHATMPKVREWIFSLRARGMFPAMTVLREVIGIENGIAAEREEIAAHRSRIGDVLLNELETGKPQQKRRFGVITFAGKSLTKTQWAKELNLTKQALDLRLQNHPVDVALSRGKDGGRPLTNKRIAPVAPSEGVETIELNAGEFWKSPAGLSHPQRRERREKMASAFTLGQSRESIAASFGVTTATVENAIKEFVRSSKLANSK